MADDKTIRAKDVLEPQCELDHASPWQLIVATILSARSTDKMVNKVTPILFERLLHGRYVCNAKKPKCAHCPLAEVCPAAEAEPEGTWQKRADAEGELVRSRGESARQPERA